MPISGGAAIAPQDVWDILVASQTTPGTIGYQLDHQLDLAISEANKWRFEASDDLLKSDDADAGTVSDTYELKKTIAFNPTPALAIDTANIDLRIKFQLQASVTAGAVFGKIYRDAVAVGTERTTSSAATDFTEDISGWTPGENINLYMKRDGSEASGVSRNFRVYAIIKSGFTEPTW